MPRQRKDYIQMQKVPLHESLNPFWQGKQQAFNEAARLQNRQIEGNNRKEKLRNEMMSELPERVKNNQFAQGVGDFVVDVRDVAPGAAVITGGALATGGLLNAYSQQQQDGLPTGPIGTLGRGAYNAVDAVSQIPIAGLGQDPYAMARNNLRDAGEALGSARVIEALALDQIDEMAVVEEGMKQLHPEIAARIDQKANELMQIQYEAAGGEPRDYNPEKAYTDAIKIVEAEIRAGS